MFESSLPIDNKPKVIKNPFYVRWRDVLLGLLIGVALIGIGLTAYYYLNLKSLSAPPEPSNTATSSAKPSNSTTTKTDETAGWKIHQTETFSIKAPDGWVVPPNDKIPGESINIQKIIDQNNYLDIQLNVQTAGGISPAAQNYETWNEVIVEFNSQKVKANEIIFKDGHWSLFPQKSGSSGEYFQLYSRQKPSNDNRDLMLKIVSTFKFD